MTAKNDHLLHDFNKWDLVIDEYERISEEIPVRAIVLLKACEISVYKPVLCKLQAVG